jgi:hypothetical protein
VILAEPPQIFTAEYRVTRSLMRVVAQEKIDHCEMERGMRKFLLSG